MRVLGFFLLAGVSLYAAKISDIANVVGVRENQLIGYSLVVGLKKSGDGSTSQFTLQSISNMLRAMNIDMAPADIKSKNVAAVVVTAKLGAFSRQGDRFDIMVSSIGDAKSLEGGTLLMTPLKGVDGKIYALGQGQVSIGGKNDGAGAKSHPTAGVVFGGGIVEREIAHDLYHQERITLSLKEPNFANAVAVQQSLNKRYKAEIATAIDPRTIVCNRPDGLSMVEFLAEVEATSIDYQAPSKIVINERTGTIVSGIDIEVKPIVITHGDITIKIRSEEALPEVEGSVKVDPDMAIGLNENELYTKKGTTTVANITRSLKKMGASPKDIISILEAMKSAGAISAELEVI